MIAFGDRQVKVRKSCYGVPKVYPPLAGYREVLSQRLISLGLRIFKTICFTLMFYGVIDYRNAMSVVRLIIA